MPDWETVKLRDVAVEGGLVGGPFGSSLGGKDYTSTGIPVIRGTNLSSSGKFDPVGFVFVSEEKFNQDLVRNSAIPGDVVFTQRGTLGQVGIVPSGPYDRYVISQSQMRLRVNKEVSSPEFLYYTFRSREIVDRILLCAITTGVPHINLSILRDFSVILPPLRLQHEISTILGTLDQKIESNRAISETASGLADSQLLLALAEVHEILLPLLRGDSDLTHAAGDWEVLTLQEACSRGGGDIQTGPFGSQLHASDYAASGVPVVMPKDISANVFVSDSVARISENTAARLSRHRLQEGDIVYSRRGDVERRALVRADNVGWLCGTGCLRVRPGRAVDKYFLAYYFGHPEVRGWIVRHAIGATMPNLNTAILGALPVILPPISLRPTLANRLAALDEIMVHAVRQNQILVELRDALLPKLMSGEIRVRDAEKIVEDVT